MDVAYIFNVGRSEAWIVVDESGHKRVGGGNLAGCDFQVASVWTQDAALFLFGTQQHTRIALNAGTVRLRGSGEGCWWKCKTGFRSPYWKRQKYLQGCVVVWRAEGVLVVGTRTRATHGRIVHRQLEILFINKRIMLAWLVSWGQTANAAAHNGRSQQWTTVKEKRELGIRGVSTPSALVISNL